MSASSFVAYLAGFSAVALGVNALDPSLPVRLVLYFAGFYVVGRLTRPLAPKRPHLDGAR